MKKSIFNVEIKGDKHLVIYNTLSSSMVRISMEEWQDIELIQEKDKNELIKLGIIVDEKTNEFLLWEKYSNYWGRKKNKTQTFVIAPTLQCNANCWYCFEKKAKRSTVDEKRVSEIVNAINSCDAEKIKIIWFGGEPTLAIENIKQILSRIKKTHIIESRMISNGYLLNKTTLDELKELKFSSLQITLDALYSEYDDCKKYNGVKRGDAFKVVIDNIISALTLGFNVSIRVNVDPLNKEKAIETINYCTREFSHYRNFSIYAAPLDVGQVLPINEQANVLLDCIKTIWTNQNYSKTDKLSYIKKMLSYNIRGCELINGVIVCGPEQNYLCHRELGKQEDIDYGEKYVMECKTCAVLPICNGGCRFNENLYGKEFRCNLIKYNIDSIIKMYYNELKR